MGLMTFLFKIDPKMTEKMQPSLYPFESYIDNINTKLPGQIVSINELKEAFFSLKPSKNPGINYLSAKVIRRCFG